jgi:hypothetical protein
MPRVPKDRTKYECLYCKERFIKMTDHMSHVIEQHDIGYRERGQRSLRPISCWGCGGAHEMPVPNFEAGEWWTCDRCGYELPRNWVNGQLVVDEPPADF